MEDDVFETESIKDEVDNNENTTIEAYYAAQKINARIEQFDLSIKPYTQRGAMVSLHF